MNKVRFLFFIESILNFFGLLLYGKKKRANINFLLSEVLKGSVNKNSLTQNSADCIIFSKDRPLQLHALICSIRHCLIGCENIFILYQASSEAYNYAYEQLRLECTLKNIYWNQEVDFRSDLLKILKKINSNLTFFLVDDIIFTEKVNFEDFKNIDFSNHVASLRLGKNLNYCYMSDAKQRLPIFLNCANLNVNDSQFLYWSWSHGSWDWSYPLSLDGHIFLSIEISKIINLINFSNPNSLEGAIQIFSDLFKSRYGVCYHKSRLVNIPNNTVQSGNGNRSQGSNPEYLLRLWDRGFRINHYYYFGYKNKSVHEELELKLKMK